MRLDLSTILGLIIAVVMLSLGIFIACSVKESLVFIDIPGLILVFGVMTGTVFVRFTMGDIKNALIVAKFAFFQKTYSPKKMIKDIYRYAEIARRDGILALENVTGEIEDPFLVKGIQLAVDGTDPELIRNLLERDLDYMQERHDRGKAVFEYFFTQSPACGMIGTLIGLVILLMKLDNPKEIGPAMAVAMMTTLYGALGAYVTFGPIAGKLDDRTKEERLIKEMIIQGVMSIQTGDNPRIVDQKLKVFLPPSSRV